MDLFRYKVKTSDFVLNDGHSLLVQFGGSPFAILQAAFGDEFHFQPWQFGQVAKNYFDEVANRRVYVDWLVNLVGVDSPSALRYEHFAQNGGGGLLHRYGNSPAKVVASLFGATPQQEIPANAPADLVLAIPSIIALTPILLPLSSFFSGIATRRRRRPRSQARSISRRLVSLVCAHGC